MQQQQQQQWQRPPGNPPASFEEISTERSKGFVKALQELRNLRPQLYSAAEYCEKSYLHNEQKQMVLDNLKDYAVRALVNAVDHLGTVAYKLTDLFEQQQIDISSLDHNISCLNQRILTCQIHGDMEGTRQQKMFAAATRHHKHYILPNSKTVHTHAKTAHPPGGNPSSRSLSWHLASESKRALNEARITEDNSSKRPATDPFRLFEDAEPVSASLPLFTHLQLGSKTTVSATTIPKSSAADVAEFSSKQFAAAFGTFDDGAGRQELSRLPVQRNNKGGALATFFGRSKPLKQRRTLVLGN